MKKKVVSILGVMALAISLTACGSSKEVSNTTTDTVVNDVVVEEASSIEETSEVETTAEVETEEASTIEDDGVYEPEFEAQYDMVTNYSDIGYSMEYDQSIFTLTSSYGMDEYSFTGDYETPSPVFILVMDNDILSAESVADGMEASSEVNDVYRTVANFGADSIEADLITYRYSVMGDDRTMTCYIIPTGENSSWLVEIGAYDDIPIILQGALEEMLGSFTITP
jgi:hypothetical protein